MWGMVKVPLLVVPVDFFPLPQPCPVKCGLRDDLPKKQRRHQWASLGLDTRNAGSEGFKDYEILACVICGMDRKVAPGAILFM
jgi:hypothetical protein